MDRRTDRPDGAGGGSPTVVTSRATGDDLTGDDLTGDDLTGGGGWPNGASAAAKDVSANGAQAQDTAAPSADISAVDGAPALPADTVGSSAAAPDSAAAADPARPSGDPSPNPPSWPASSASGSSGHVPPGRLAPADQSSVPPAAFTWEMPDSPVSSPSSPARNFLRPGLSGGGSAAEADSSGGVGQASAVADPAVAPEPGRKDSPQKAPAQKAPAAKKKAKRTARQAHLTIGRVEPWSVMKFSFVISLVAFVILFIAVSVLYAVLSAVGLFDSLQHVVTSLTSSQGSPGVNAKVWFSSSKVLGYTALLGSLNIVLITAMCTIGAVVYNLTSRLVGGVEVTLRETE